MFLRGGLFICAGISNVFCVVWLWLQSITCDMGPGLYLYHVPVLLYECCVYVFMHVASRCFTVWGACGCCSMFKVGSCCFGSAVLCDSGFVFVLARWFQIHILSRSSWVAKLLGA